MRKRTGLILLGGLTIGGTIALAQRPGGGPPADRGGGDLVARMMEFDKDKDGKLTRDEITDRRLQRLFDRADANKDAVVSKEELMALAAKEPDDAGGPPGFGPPGFGPPGFGPPGGPMMGPPRPGVILPPPVLQMLQLTDEQKEQVDALQKEVDARLAKILNETQRKQLKEMSERGPGRFGPGGGRRGGPPGGGPPPR
jgi:hypothetical protein